MIVEPSLLLTYGMKTCARCKQSKAESEFYRHRGTRDGLQVVCKECKKIEVREGYKRRNGKRSPEARSTRLVREILEMEGIPCLSGIVAECHVDLVAWGCIPIEAKASQATQKGSFLWGFSPGQVGPNCKGFLVCIAEQCDRRTVYVIPRNHPNLPERGLSVMMKSNHGNSKNYAWVSEYENRFDLIEQARQEWFLSARTCRPPSKESICA